MFSNLAIAVLNYERPLDTIECLESIFVSTPSSTRIFIIDNGSTDDSVNKIKTKFPKIDVVRIFPNCGFAGGMNAAIRECMRIPDVDRILLVSNDTIFDSKAILELTNTSWDVAIPKILFNKDRNRIWSAGARWRKVPPMVVIRGYQELDLGQYDQPVPLDSATGCVFLINKKVLEKISGFDDTYQFYMEDYDFFYRISEQGFSIGYVPNARIYHKVSLTIGHRSPTQFHYIGRNTVYFYRKNKRYPMISLIMVLAWVIGREMVHGNFPGVRTYLTGVVRGFQDLKRSARDTKNQFA